MILWLLACQAPSPAPTTEVAQTELVGLEAPRLLRRISLDLRGRVPTADELDAVADDPDLVDDYTQAWLDGPELEERLVDLMAEHFQTRLDVFQTRWFDYGLGADQEHAFERSVADEPLRLAARIVTQDLPWSTLVTADWTMANPLLAEVWPLERDDGEDWQPARYIDGRPGAGVLSTNGLWWRYVTSPSNKNRSRAEAILRLLVCYDILAQPISFASAGDLDSSPDELIWENEGCISCHETVDPLAASLFGFYWLMEYSEAEMTSYHPEREPLGPDILGVEPAWGGSPVTDLADLGRSIADDTGFGWCAAQTVATLTWRRDVDAVADTNALQPLFEAWDSGGGRLKPVIAASMQTEVYRAGGVDADADLTLLDGEETARMLSPDVLHDAVADLTGFTWTYDGFDMLGNDELGFRVLAGGVDGDAVTRPQRDPGLTWALVVKRLAEGAADHAVQQALAGAAPSVLSGIDVQSSPDDATLAALHWRLFAEAADDEWLRDVAALWQAVAEADGAAAAWTAVLSVMLRDPAFVSA